jgi:hypothetical protein
MSEKFFDLLRNFLETGKDWDTIETDIKGISVIKIPATKTRSSKLMVQLFLYDDNGRAMKSKGVIVDLPILHQLRKLLLNNIDPLLHFLDEINPKLKKSNKQVIELTGMEKMVDEVKKNKLQLPESEIDDEHHSDEKLT